MLADAYGNFEINSRVIHSKAYAPIRPFVTEGQVRGFLADFEKHGLLYTWAENGKRYGHWTGSEKQGRLPPYTHRDRYSGNINVRKLYDKESGLPADQGLINYLERTASACAEEPQIDLPIPRSEAAYGIQKEAERSVTNAQSFLYTPDFRKFKEMYPPKGWVHERHTRDEFAKLNSFEVALLFEGLERHIASASWKKGYVPDCDRFVDEKYWNKPPRENTNDGPSGRTTEDYIERKKQNRKTLGLDN